MPYDPTRHHRRSIRLKGYDYSQAGAYFITICVHRGHSELGEIVDGLMVPSEYGRIVMEAWEGLPNHYPNANLDAFVLMPNHVHAILLLDDGMPPIVEAGASSAGAHRHGLPEVVRGFKTFSAARINTLKGVRGVPFWQRNYYEHIIRNERSYLAISDYIARNPLNSGADKLHPNAGANQFNRHWR